MESQSPRLSVQQVRRVSGPGLGVVDVDERVDALLAGIRDYALSGDVHQATIRGGSRDPRFMARSRSPSSSGASTVTRSFTRRGSTIAVPRFRIEGMFAVDQTQYGTTFWAPVGLFSNGLASFSIVSLRSAECREMYRYVGVYPICDYILRPPQVLLHDLGRDRSRDNHAVLEVEPSNAGPYLELSTRLVQHGLERLEDLPVEIELAGETAARGFVDLTPQTSPCCKGNSTSFR